MAEFSLKEGHNGTLKISFDKCQIKEETDNMTIPDGDGVNVSVSIENYALCVVNIRPASSDGVEMLTIDLARVYGSGDLYIPKASIYINDAKVDIEPTVVQTTGYELRFNAFEYNMLPWAEQQGVADDVRTKLTDNFADAFGGQYVEWYHYIILAHETLLDVCGNVNVDDVTGEGICINPYGFFDFFTNEVNDLPFAPAVENNWNYVQGFIDISNTTPWKMPEERMEKDTDGLFSWFYGSQMNIGFNIQSNSEYNGSVSAFSDWIFDRNYIMVQILAEWDLENLGLEEKRYHRFKGVKWDVWLDGDGKATAITIKQTTIGGDMPERYFGVVGFSNTAVGTQWFEGVGTLMITQDVFTESRLYYFDLLKEFHSGYVLQGYDLGMIFYVVDTTSNELLAYLPHSTSGRFIIPANLPDSADDIPVTYNSYDDKLNISVEIIIHLGLYEGDKYDDNEEDSDDITESDGYNGIGLLTTQYGMTEGRCKQLGYNFWGASFIENIKLVNNNPIENVIGLKIYPFDVSGTEEEIVVGNVPMKTNGERIDSFNNKVTIGSTKIEGMYNSFLDFAPFTKLTIWLPFIGFKDLDVSACMYKTLTVRYIRDIITGACKADLLLDGKPWQTYDGEMGIDIALMSSNRAQVDAAFVNNAISTVANGVGNIASGSSPISGQAGTLGTVVGIADIATDLVASAMNQYHTTNSGVPSPSCSAYQTRDVFLIYDRPTYQDLAVFNHTYGRMCMLSRTLGGLTGFTKTNPMINMDGVPCTEEEKQRLIVIMSNGFFIN